MILVNCDGGSRGNPGPAAIGVVVWTEDRKVLEECGESIGDATNNIAEYKALIKALELAAKHGDEVKIFMDSELVIRQMTGEYNVKARHLFPLFMQAKEKEKAFKKVTYDSLPREDRFQQRADMLVNTALDSR